MTSALQAASWVIKNSLKSGRNKSDVLKRFFLNKSNFYNLHVIFFDVDWKNGTRFFIFFCSHLIKPPCDDVAASALIVE